MTFKEAEKFVFFLPRRAAVGLISIYQVLLSPDYSWLKGRFPHGYCRYYPSCSEYSKQSIIKFGIIRGLWLSVKRLVRCHPWAQPQVDPVPKF
jgi:putative membrane protein insertion efficiency factor